MARHASLAEYYRAHREAFTLSLELGCTPKEAAAELGRRAAHNHWRASQAKVEPTIDTPCSVAPSGHDLEERPGPWWQRD